jgi:hypothetical protein
MGALSYWCETSKTRRCMVSCQIVRLLQSKTKGGFQLANIITKEQVATLVEAYDSDDLQKQAAIAEEYAKLFGSVADWDMYQEGLISAQEVIGNILSNTHGD